jgi:hypothetical protein
METLDVVGFDWAVHGPKLVFLNGLADNYKNILVNRGDIEQKSVGDLAAILRNAEAAGSLAGGPGGAGSGHGSGSGRSSSNRNTKHVSANAPAPANTYAPISNSSSGDAAPRGSNAAGPSRRAAMPGNGNSGGKRGPRDLSNVACNRCGELGHLAADCPSDTHKMRAHRARQ